jgi:hypothetical protein
MHKPVFPFILAVAAAAVAACLVGPANDSSTDNNTALQCKGDERPFNGACQKTCASSADCPAAERCMVVGTNESLCLDYSGCAYLGSDTSCTPPEPSYGGYGSYDPSAGCVGNALWQVAPASGSPQCGQPHAVTRCVRSNDRCVLVPQTTYDTADR